MTYPEHASAPGWRTEGGAKDQVDAGSVLPIVAPDAHEIPAGAPTIVREPTAWLRSAVGAKVKQIRARGLDPEGEALIITPLGRTRGEEDRTCDRCGHHAPEGELFYPVAHRPTRSMLVIIGLCQSCVRLEVGA